MIFFHTFSTITSMVALITPVETGTIDEVTLFFTKAVTTNRAAVLSKLTPVAF